MKQSAIWLGTFLILVIVPGAVYAIEGDIYGSAEVSDDMNTSIEENDSNDDFSSGMDDEDDDSDSNMSGSFYLIGDGRVNIGTDEDNDSELLDGQFEADLDLQTNTNNPQLVVLLSDGTESEVRITPSQAAARAGTALNTECSEDCEMTLQEESYNGEARAAYEVKTYRPARLLGFIPMRMKMQADIDAETGAVLDTSRSWWASMATQTGGQYNA